MNVLKSTCVTVLFVGFLSNLSHAKEGFGLNVATGLPFVQQVGINYMLSEKLSLSANYGLLDLSVGTAKAKLAMPEVMVHFYPFSAAFFIAAGVGQESLEVTSTEAGSNNPISIEVTAMTAIAKAGWMWGLANGGFWFGVDVSYVKPLSPERTVTAPGVPTTDPSFQDAVDSADRFGDQAYTTITFARLGYLF